MISVLYGSIAGIAALIGLLMENKYVLMFGAVYAIMFVGFHVGDKIKER
jgi:hypothetical protein